MSALTAFDFLNAPLEDVYTLEDGQPFEDGGGGPEGAP